MIRIAFVVHTFDMGGLERCVARLVNHLNPDEFEPSIICLNRNGNAAEWLDRSVPIAELKKKKGQDIGVISRLAKVLRDTGVHIVHSHNWGTLVETSLARKRAGTPRHVHAERGMELTDRNAKFWRRKFRGWASRWAFRRADAVLAVAEAVRQDVTRRTGYCSANIRVIPNGVDVPTAVPGARSEIRDKIGAGEDTLVIGSLGRLAAVKDYPTAVAALSKLRQRGRNCKLVILGDGPEEQVLRHASEEAGVAEDLRLVGRRENTGDWLSAFDVYLNCSLNEGMSQAILEAMAVGLPIVATDVGDNRRLVENAELASCCGIVVPPGDPKQIADACERLLKEELRVESGRRAKEIHASSFGVHHMTATYESFYRDLAADIPVC